LNVIRSIFVLHRFYRKVNFVIGQISFIKSVLFWYDALDFLSDGKTCFIKPASGHIMN